MGCATMTLTYSPCNADITATLSAQGEMECSYDKGVMTCTYDKGTMETDMGARGSMETTLSARGQMTLSLVCTVDLVPIVISVLHTSDGVPLLTLQGEYLILRD